MPFIHVNKNMINSSMFVYTRWWRKLEHHARTQVLWTKSPHRIYFVELRRHSDCWKCSDTLHIDLHNEWFHSRWCGSNRWWSFEFSTRRVVDLYCNIQQRCCCVGLEKQPHSHSCVYWCSWWIQPRVESVSVELRQLKTYDYDYGWGRCVGIYVERHNVEFDIHIEWTCDRFRAE